MPTWTFRARFRQNAYGWKGSRLAIERIGAALTEIRAVARHDPAAAAEGAVLFLEKLSPALQHVDSSSGALGNATYAAVEELVPIISAAPVDKRVRSKWLDRLFDAIQDDDPPYIENLGDHWGTLCASQELASAWADQLLPTQRSVLTERKSGMYAFFRGTPLCYSALFTAGRHDELMKLLAMDPAPIWHYSVWGARVLAARGHVDQAIAYAHEHAGGSVQAETLARFAEDLLLAAGRRAEAFEKYALLANRANSHLSTFRSLAKKYPQLQAAKLLKHLIASTPDEPGKWFATAKTLKLFEEAMQLAWASPCEPTTLTRAARDHLVKHPQFSLQCALAALHWMSLGHGYELTGIDVAQAYRLAVQAAQATEQVELVNRQIAQCLMPERPMANWMRQCLGAAPIR